MAEYLKSDSARILNNVFHVRAQILRLSLTDVKLSLKTGKFTVADTIFGHPINPSQVPIIRPTIGMVGWL
jgi:hypothetical protein